MTDIVILPGIGGSGELHWQTRWEKSNPQCRRFQPADWNRPELEDWISALDRAVGAAPKPPLLVAHSLACLLVAHSQQASTAPVAGAFLVAVPNPQSEAFPVEAASFANPPPSEIQISLTRHRERKRSIRHDRACPRESERSGEAALWKWESLATSTRQAGLGTGRREKHCLRLLRPRSRVDTNAICR